VSSIDLARDYPRCSDISCVVFDRMFSLGVHMTPLSGHGVVASPGAGPRRHFLFCTLKDDKERKRNKSRDGITATTGSGGALANSGNLARSGLTLSRAF
jgi:hypothetical protein